MAEENRDLHDRETWAGDSELARSIWDRYARAPGVIPMAGALQLARRITRMSVHGLPLLADVQRRWLPAASSFPGTWTALPYASLPRLARSLSASPKRGMRTAPPVATGVKLAVQRRVASPPETTRVMAGHWPGAARPILGDIAPAHVSAGDLSVAAVQRRLESLPGQAARADLAMPSPTRLSSDLLPLPVQKPEVDADGVGVPTFRAEPPAVRAEESTVRGMVRAESKVTTSACAGEAGLAIDILQRHSDMPVESMLQRRSDRSVAQTAPPALPGIASTEASVLQRPLLGRVIPGQQRATAAAMRRRAADLPLLQASSSAAKSGTRSQPISPQPSTGSRTDRSAKALAQVPSGEDIRSSESASTPGRSAASVGTRAQTTAPSDLGRAVLQRYVDMPLIHSVPSVRAQPGYGGMSVTVGAGGSSPSRRPLLPAIESVGLPYGDRLFAPRAEMPLARAVGRGSATDRRGLTSPSGVAQRAIELPYDAPPLAAEPHVSWPVPGEGPPAPPVAPETPQPSFEGIDLERLADAVYSLIEQRLIVERESMGF